MGAYLALAGLQLVSGYQNSQITLQNGELQNNIAQMNEQFAQYNAYQAQRQGYGNAAKYQEGVNATQAQDTAAEAGAGQDVKYGTASDLTADNRIAGLANTIQIQRQAQNQAVGIETQGINIGLGGQMAQLQSSITAGAQETSALLGAASTSVAGYAFSQSTGKGTTSRTGTDDSPSNAWAMNPTMNLTNTGDGVTANPTLYSGSPYGWYPDPSSDAQGFFGLGPRSVYGFSGGSFTQEAS